MTDARLNMLVADDSPLIQRVFRDAVASSRLPIQLTECHNGRDCMAALSRPDMHLAFIDVFMPEMSGTEALTQARLRGNKTFGRSSGPKERRTTAARTSADVPPRGWNGCSTSRAAARWTSSTWASSPSRSCWRRV